MKAIKETIDKRTYHGKELVKKIKTLDADKMHRAAEDMDIHPALTALRLKDLYVFLNGKNTCLN